MTPEQIADCSSDLLEFTRTMFRARKGADMKPSWHQDAICSALERVLMGKCTRLIINIPPRSGKTELAVLNFIAWATGIYPDSEWIHASYSKRLATNNTYGVREIMRHEVYQQIFPWVDIRNDSNAKDEFRTEQGGIVYATGAEGSITGRGAGKMRDTFGGCFAYHQMVKTEKGDIKIGELVSSKKDYRVWSYCEETGSARLSKILQHWKNPANDIIRIALSDGSQIDCTPDHEILTKAGWVSAIHFAKALNLVDAEPGNLSSLHSAETPVYGDFYDAFRVLWFCIPLGVREGLRDRFPSLAGLDLADNANANAVTLCEDGRAFGALEYFNNLFSVEFGSGAALEEWERPVPDGVLHVVGLSAIREIAQVVVGGVSVEMSNLIPVGAFTYKLLSDQVRDVASFNFSANRQVYPEIPLPVARRLQKSDGLCPSDLSGVRNLIQAEGVADVFPIGVFYAGHVDATYCLEVEDDNNFTLSQSGAIVSNCIIIDDPHKPGEANSAVMRQNVLDWFATTMESRKNRPDTPIIVIKQRLHENDLSGWLLGGGNGEHWDHLCIPAVNDQGESFWPEQFPLDMLERIKASNSYVFAGQYMQAPAPAGGGIFKSEWIRHWSVLPDFEYRMIYADTAMKTGEENDFSVFQHWGKGKDGKIYLLDMIRGKWEAPQLLMQAKAFWDKCRNQHSGALRKLKIEDKASGTGLIQQIKQTGIPVEGIPRNRDKTSRAYDTAPQIEAGNVLLMPSNEHLSDMLHELAVFPMAAHDDCVDPLMDAVQDMLNSHVGINRPIPVSFQL